MFREVSVATTVECATDCKRWTLLSERDQACIWHPFTQALNAAPPIPIVKGRGSYLYAETGEGYLDGISSWWVNLHGHGHPYIGEKIGSQAKELEHVLFAGFTHPQAVRLLRGSLACLGHTIPVFFISDNGSTAVETALKMVLQSGGKKLLSFEGGYHGDTFGAMSAGGKSFCNRPFWPYLFEVASIPPPLFGKRRNPGKHSRRRSRRERSVPLFSSR